MATQKLIVFKHDNELGKAPAHKLFDMVKIDKKDESKPSRAFSDYNVIVDKSAVPQGVKVLELL